MPSVRSGLCRAPIKCLYSSSTFPYGGHTGTGRGCYPSTGMDCSKSDPNSSLYKGGKWARTMSGYIALKAVSFSVCLLHSARSVDTLHINCGERERGRETERERERRDGRFRFTGKQECGVVAERNTPAISVASHTVASTPVNIDMNAEAQERAALDYRAGAIDNSPRVCE